MSLIIFLLMVFVSIVPKINIISIGSSTAGIRLEDFLLLIVLIFIFVLNKGKILRETNEELNKIQRCFYIYFFFSIISCIYGIAQNYVSSVTCVLFLVRKIEYFMFIYIGFFYGKRLNKEKVKKFFDILIIIHLTFSLLQFFGFMGSFNKGEAISILTQGRIASTFNGAYEYSAFLLLIVPFYMNELLFNRNEKIKNFIFLLIISFCIYISQSRTSMICEIIIILLIIINSRVLLKKSGFVKAVFFIIIVILSILPMNSKIDLSRFSNISIKKISYLVDYTWQNKDFKNYAETRNWYGNATITLNQMDAMGYDGSLYARLSHWMQLIDGWISSPLIGVGVSIAGNSADGNYIKILAETGIAGIISWIFLLKEILRYCKEKKSFLYYSILSIIIGAIAIDLFDASKVMMFTWFMLGVLIYKDE